MQKRLLFKSVHFHEAIQNKWHITVYQQDELLDKGGIIESQTLTTVKIGDNHYFKASCQFVVRGSMNTSKHVDELS